MRIIEWTGLVSKERLTSPVAMTIGVFDSVHLGHQRLIAKIVKTPDILPVVCTFLQNPKSVLKKGTAPGNVLSFRQKITRFESLGVKNVVLIDFSYEFSKLTGKQFIRQLTDRVDLKKLVVGYNFYFGRGRNTGPIQLGKILERTDINLEVIPPVLHQDEIISSSRIRKAILEGCISDIRIMLDADFSLDLQTISMEMKKNNCTWIPKERIKQVLPGKGTYKVIFKTEYTEIPGKLEIRNEGIYWESCNEEHIKEISFIDRLS